LKNLDDQLPIIISDKSPPPSLGDKSLTKQIVPFFTDKYGNISAPQTTISLDTGAPVYGYPAVVTELLPKIDIIISNLIDNNKVSQNIKNAGIISKVKCDVNLKNNLNLLINNLKLIQPLMDIIFQMNPEYIQQINYGEQVKFLPQTGAVFSLIPKLADLQQKQLPLNAPRMAAFYASYYTLVLNTLCAGI
jgi:hypothetical protein